jgi:hypothetical protein
MNPAVAYPLVRPPVVETKSDVVGSVPPLMDETFSWRVLKVNAVTVFAFKRMVLRVADPKDDVVRDEIEAANKEVPPNIYHFPLTPYNVWIPKDSLRRRVVVPSSNVSPPCVERVSDLFGKLP